MSTETSEAATYSIGAVARLTGIPVDTVRMWERRYEVVKPVRNEGNKRRYAAQDIARLTLIKRLVDRGNPISTVAALGEQQLRERLQLHEHAQAHSAPREGPRRTLIFGETLPFDTDANHAVLGRFEILGTYTDVAEFERVALSSHPEVLVYEFPALTQDNVVQILNLMRRIGNPTTIVVYAYATRVVLQRLEQAAGVRLLRAPTTLAAIEALGDPALDRSPIPPGGDADPGLFHNTTPRRYSNWQLAEIARASSSIKCECPQQLVDLLYRLSAFEAYSLDCENRNDQDIAIHAYLYRATAHARATIEQALAHLIELEGMSVPESTDRK